VRSIFNAKVESLGNLGDSSPYGSSAAHHILVIGKPRHFLTENLGKVAVFFRGTTVCAARFAIQPRRHAHLGRSAMSKQHFFLKLIPPRPTFAQDMTDQERAVMQEHVNYVGEAFRQGLVLIYGPVMAPEGAYGMAVLEMADAAEVQKYMSEDPSIKSGLNTFEFYPMRVGQARGAN
jgi:uncharacterized protein